jgi:hypothetical protein
MNNDGNFDANEVVSFPPAELKNKGFEYFQLSLSGCSTVTYELTDFNFNGDPYTEVKISAETVLYKRQLGGQFDIQATGDLLFNPDDLNSYIATGGCPNDEPSLTFKLCGPVSFCLQDSFGDCEDSNCGGRTTDAPQVPCDGICNPTTDVLENNMCVNCGGGGTMAPQVACQIDGKATCDDDATKVISCVCFLLVCRAPSSSISVALVGRH